MKHLIFCAGLLMPTLGQAAVIHLAAKTPQWSSDAPTLKSLVEQCLALGGAPDGEKRLRYRPIWPMWSGFILTIPCSIEGLRGTEN